MSIRLFIILIVIVSQMWMVSAQTGGTYDLSHNVIASGGGSNASGGTFSVDGTIGQAAAGTQSSNGNFSLRGGFWNFHALAPTAAFVLVSGRVVATSGGGISWARIALTGANGETRTALTNSFGYFRFNDVAVGETYIFIAQHKWYQFAPQVVTVNDAIDDLIFTALNEAPLSSENLGSGSKQDQESNRYAVGSRFNLQSPSAWRHTLSDRVGRIQSR